MITVFGLGFVGLTTALAFADQGKIVYGIDPNQNRRETLLAGRVPFQEPHLEEALHRTLGKTFFIQQDCTEAVQDSTFLFYCVGTPYGENGQADLSYLMDALESSFAAIRDERYRVCVIKSTVPPSTTAEKIKPFLESRFGPAGGRLGLANNPEFLREGYCWEDFVNADKIVLGCEDKRTVDLLSELYSGFRCPVITVSYNTGEFIKYLSNTLLATMISYSNEMSLVADCFGDIDVAKAFQAIHMDRRWGNASMRSYVYPGCGYGGYCLPKDTNALYAQSVHKGYEPRILRQVIEVNDRMAEETAKKIAARAAGMDTPIGILGLAFKPGSDDVRDTPAAKIIEKLMHLGYKKLYAYDPMAMENFQKHFQLDIKYCDSIQNVIGQADIIAILTAWPEFRAVKKASKSVVDCRYMGEV